MAKQQIKEIIVVEGKYDKINLSNVVDADIICSSGFGIFNDEKKREYIKNMAEKRGIIILTDSDSAGFLIRNNIKSFVNPDLIKNAYVPKFEGKEKRKSSPSKERLLGVEGMNPEILISALKNCGASFIDEKETDRDKNGKLTKSDFYRLGLSGGKDSSKKRAALTAKLNLPDYINTKELINYINICMTEDEFYGIMEEL